MTDRLISNIVTTPAIHVNTPNIQVNKPQEPIYWNSHNNGVYGTFSAVPGEVPRFSPGTSYDPANSVEVKSDRPPIVPKKYLQGVPQSVTLGPRLYVKPTLLNTPESNFQEIQTRNPNVSIASNPNSMYDIMPENYGKVPSIPPSNEVQPDIYRNGGGMEPELLKRYTALNTPATQFTTISRQRVTNVSTPVLNDKQKLLQSYMIGRDTSPRVAVDYVSEYTANHGSAPVYNPFPINILPSPPSPPPTIIKTYTTMSWTKPPTPRTTVPPITVGPNKYKVVNLYMPGYSKSLGYDTPNTMFLIENEGSANERITIVGAGGDGSRGISGYGWVAQAGKYDKFNNKYNVEGNPYINTNVTAQNVQAVQKYMKGLGTQTPRIDLSWQPNPPGVKVAQRKQHSNKKHTMYKTTPKKSASTKKSLMMRVQNVQTIKPITYVKSKPLGIRGFNEINKSKSKHISIKGFGFGGMSGKVNTQMFKSGVNIKGMTGVKPKKPVKQPQKSFKNFGKGLF